jgi:diguanylate cyclase (GGDEF)-like protein/PAS domain S-box-containing protein
MSSQAIEPGLVLQELLERYPVARISALSPDGSPQPVPDEVAVGNGQIRIASPGLAGYLPEDRPGILVAFDRALEHGVGEARARALNAPEVLLAVHLVNMCARHQVIIAISVVQDTEASSHRLTELPLIPPRVARIKKSQTAAIIDIDPATTSILGWTAEDMLGKRSLEFIHPDDQHLAIENWLRLRANPNTDVRSRLRHQAADGSWLWFEVSQSNLLDTGEECVVAELIDISIEMAAQQALETREQLLHQLTQTLPLGIFQIDSQGSLVFSNDQLFEILGVPATVAVENLFGHASPEQWERLDAAIAAVLNGETERSVELQLAGEHMSELKTCHVILRPLADNTGQTMGAVGCLADVTESVAMRRELEHRATYDSLTGCHNRQAVLTQLERDRAAMTPAGPGLGVIFVDLDQFKAVNDDYGHPAGNALLIDTAARLRSAVNERATVGRIGGDEFLVVAPDLESADQGAQLATEIANVLRNDMPIAGRLVPCSASVGMAWTNDASCGSDRLVAEADNAMYAMKRDRTRGAFSDRRVPQPRTTSTATTYHKNPAHP